MTLAVPVENVRFASFVESVCARRVGRSRVRNGVRCAVALTIKACAGSGDVGDSESAMGQHEIVHVKSNYAFPGGGWLKNDSRAIVRG